MLFLRVRATKTAPGTVRQAHYSRRDAVHAMALAANGPARQEVHTRAGRDIPMKPLGDSDATGPSQLLEGQPGVDVPIISVSAVPEASSAPPASDFKKVCVAGATGGVGREIVRQLAASGVQVVALVRDITKASTELPSANVELATGDLYQFASLSPALDGCDAIICAAGFSDMLDPLGPFKVDYTGTVNLVEAGKQAGISRFVLVTSIGTDDGLLSPLGPVLFWKKRAEEHLQRSGLVYTIVRPGGLVSESSGTSGSASSADRNDGLSAVRGAVQGLLQGVFGEARARGQGNLVIGGPMTFGVPPKKSGSVLRSKVAECCVAALGQPDAENSVVELIADEAAPALTWEQLFKAANM